MIHTSRLVKVGLAFLLSLFTFTTITAQSDNKVTLSGSVQSDMMIAPQVDNTIGAYEDSYDNKNFLTNTYIDLLLHSRDIDAGVRAEINEWPMPGYNDPDKGIKFKGWGLPHFWVKGRGKKVDLTLGTFYEQFGSGFILRTYEERSLGIDNSLLGAKFTARPTDGVKLTALSGVQRNYWEWDMNSVISGADMELSIDDWVKALQQHGTHLSVGASWVNKRDNANENNPDYFVFQGLDKYRVNVPEFVNAYDVRLRFQQSGFALLAEYAQKTDDPNSLNNYTFGKGSAAMLSMTYAGKGLSLLAQAKRSENMGFRSRRGYSSVSPSCYVNHLPAFTLDHTYSLAALYPYATQTEGEWAFQGGIGYNFKRKTTLGGKYGTKVKLNYSLVKGLEHNQQKGEKGGSTIDNSFFGMGETYYQDLNLQFEKRLTKTFDIHLVYMNQQYNKSIIEGHGDMVKSHIFIAEGKQKFSKKLTLRAEAQYLLTGHESGDWGFGLVELSVAPYLMFTLSDQIGRYEDAQSVTGYGNVAHYYNASVTGTYRSHRLQIGYGRTRSGYNCTGGVCRFVPASKGLTISYNYNF